MDRRIGAKELWPNGRPPACARALPHAQRVAIEPGRPPACAAIVGTGATLYGRAGIGVATGPLEPPRQGPVAQWLEPAAHNGLVGGSSPPGPTNNINSL
jgi:hypothetical protein